MEYEHALMEIQEMDRRNAPKEEIDVDVCHTPFPLFYWFINQQNASKKKK